MKVSGGKEKVQDIAADRHPRSRRRSRSKSRSACRGRPATEKASSQGSRHDGGRLSNEPSHRYSARDNPTKPRYTLPMQPSTSASYGQQGPTKYSGSQRIRGQVCVANERGCLKIQAAALQDDVRKSDPEAVIKSGFLSIISLARRILVPIFDIRVQQAKAGTVNNHPRLAFSARIKGISNNHKRLTR